MTDCYGVNGDPDGIDVEPTIAGDSPVLDPKYRNPRQAVRIDDESVEHTFVLEPDTVRDMAERMREHTPRQECYVLAQRFEDAADRAEELEVPSYDDNTN